MLYNSKKCSYYPLLILYFCKQLIWKIRQIPVYLLFIIYLIIKEKTPRTYYIAFTNLIRLKEIDRIKEKVKVVSGEQD